MATVSIVKIKVRRGTDATRTQIILDQGELGFVTDPASYRLFIGDGITYGGNPAAMKLYIGNLIEPGSLITAQIGDLIYNLNDTKLYTLTGSNGSGFPDYSNPGAYSFIGPTVDNQTINYNGGGSLSLENQGISAIHVNNTVFDFTNGITRVLPNGPFSVNYDNNTIVMTSGQLTVNINALNPEFLPTVNPGPGAMWNNNGVINAGF